MAVADSRDKQPVVGRDILPTNVTPIHYQLHLVPSLTTFVHHGTVEIRLRVNESTSEIHFNAAQLTLHSASVRTTVAKSESEISATKIDYHEEPQQYHLVFEQEFEKGQELLLTLKFEGSINDQMTGLYRSSYQTTKGEQKYMAVTQFESTDARMAFPCWDEPAVKASFDISLTIPRSLRALSNMNVISEDDLSSPPAEFASDAKETEKEWKTIKFATTPIMSTYLVAFAVGDFDWIETTTSPSCKHLPQPVTVRVYVPKDFSESGKVESVDTSEDGPSSSTMKGKFALSCAAKTLEYFSGLFNEPYPLPKMDLLAVPDFSAGAMENWGLVTYRTVALLYDEAASSARAKQLIAYIVAHELAHQWFGNLVTMHWWTHLWLNEGFATWVGWLAVDHIFPEWDVWTRFMSDDYASALDLDSLKSSHAIEIPVQNPSEISQIFDAISYSKGASVIRMLAQFLGEETFLEGVRIYLKKYKFANALSKDLWECLSEATKSTAKPTDVGKFIGNWTRTMGYPVVTVKERDSPKGAKLDISQTRYLSNGDKEDRSWQVPLRFYVGKHTEKGHEPVEAAQELPRTLDAPSAQVTIDLPSSGFYKLNYEESGFFRVQYPDNVLEKLGSIIANSYDQIQGLTGHQLVQKGFLTARDRIGLVNDAFALAVAGLGSTVTALRLLSSLAQETTFLVLKEIAANLKLLQSVWYHEPAEVRERLFKVTRGVFSKKAEDQGWDFPRDEDEMKALERTLVVSMAGDAGDRKVIDEAKKRFQRFVGGDASALHPNIRGNAYRMVLREGSSAEFQAILSIYKSATEADQKDAALAALAAASDPELIKRAFQIAIDPEQVRPQDIITGFRGFAMNPVATRIVWGLIKEHWTVLSARYNLPAISFFFGRCVSAVVQQFTSNEAADEIEAFFFKEEVKGEDGKTSVRGKKIEMPIRQALEKIRTRARWLKRSRDGVETYLKETYP